MWCSESHVFVRKLQAETLPFHVCNSLQTKNEKTQCMLDIFGYNTARCLRSIPELFNLTTYKSTSVAYTIVSILANV